MLMWHLLVCEVWQQDKISTSWERFFLLPDENLVMAYSRCNYNEKPATQEGNTVKSVET